MKKQNHKTVAESIAREGNTTQNPLLPLVKYSANEADLTTQVSAIVVGVVKKILSGYFHEINDLAKIRQEKFTVEDACDQLIRNAILKVTASGAGAGAGITAMVPLLLSGAGAPAATAGALSIQLSELAYLLSVQTTLVLEIAEMCGRKISKENPDEAITILAMGFGLKVSGKLREEISKRILPYLTKVLIKRNVSALAPAVNIVSIAAYNGVSTYYVGQMAKSLFLQNPDLLEFAFDSVLDVSIALLQDKQTDVDFDDFNK